MANKNNQSTFTHATINFEARLLSSLVGSVKYFSVLLRFLSFLFFFVSFFWFFRIHDINEQNVSDFPIGDKFLYTKIVGYPASITSILRFFAINGQTFSLRSKGWRYARRWRVAIDESVFVTFFLGDGDTLDR